MSIKKAIDQNNAEKKKKCDTETMVKRINRLYELLISQKDDLTSLGVKEITNGGGGDISKAGWSPGTVVNLQIKAKSFFATTYWVSIVTIYESYYIVDLHFCKGYDAVEVWKATVEDSEVEKAVVEALDLYKEIKK